MEKEDRPRFSGTSTISGRIIGRGFGQGNQAAAEKEQNLIDLDESQASESRQVSYTEAVRSKSYSKNIDFPAFRPQVRPSDRQSRLSQAFNELENEEVNLIDQKEDRSGRNMSRRREQIIGEIVGKLREELRVDILRIIREEVRENLRQIIGNSIKEELNAIFQEGGAFFVKKAARVSFEENIRERVVDSMTDEIVESESEERDRSTTEK